MAEKEESAKKTPKKVVVVDANEQQDDVVPEQDDKKNEGDTPPLAESLQQNADKEQSVDLNEDVSSDEKEKPAVENEDEPADLPKDITIEEAIQQTAIEETEDSLDDDKQTKTNDETKQEPESSVSSVGTEPWDDETTEKAVDDIVASDSDELLARQDAEKDEAEKQIPAPKRSLRTKLKELWSIPSFKWGILVGLLVLFAGLALIPGIRYSILNAAGANAGMSLTVLNNENQQPLKNATVSVNGKTAQTDEKGVVGFTNLRLGKSDISISKRGYAEVKITKVLGWGSNPLGQIKMNVTGAQFTFTVTDFLSGKPIEKAEALSGDYNAQADSAGKILLPLDIENDSDIEITIKAQGYREEKIKLAANDNAEKKVQLIPSKKHVFVTKRTGKYDVYKVDADGKNEALLMQASGNERDDIALLPHPTKDFVAIVSTREGKRNKDGYLLSNLFVVDVQSGQVTKLQQSERIQLVDWTGDRIVFIAVTEGASAANPARSKIFSFEIGQPGAKEIASANYFNDVTVFKDVIYYAPSSYSIPVASAKYFRMNPDGSNNSVLLDKEVWNIFRSDYDTLLLAVQQDWYQHGSGSSPSKMNTAPANPRNRVYRDNPSKTKALWIDVRDGKGVLLSHDVASKNEEILQTQGGLTLPVSWLNDTTFVYRISDGREVADYIKSIDGGEPRKLKDVTSTEQYNYFNY